MRNSVLLTFLCCAALGLTGCAKPDEQADQGANATATGPAPGPNVNTVLPPDEAPSATPFDVQKVDQKASLAGQFPYVDNSGVPAGAQPAVQKVLTTTVPIWTGDRLVQVKGKVHQQVFTTNAKGTFSSQEAQKFVSDFVTKLGGTAVTESYISDQAADELTKSKTADQLVAGLGDIYNQPVRTYLVRTTDRQVWIQSVSNVSQTTLMVVEGSPSS